MKRLLDGNSDHFERALLRAGSEVRPDPAAKRRLLTAMAAGTLVASAGGGASHAATAPWWKALLATKAGKATLLGLAVAGSGGAFVALRAPVREAPILPLRGLELSTSRPELATQPSVTTTPHQPATPSPPSQQGSAVEPTSTAHAPVPARVRTNKGERHEKFAPIVETSGPSAIVLEARLVERLRGAIHAGEAATVSELLSQYRSSFPAGQLRPEVNKLETQWRAR